MDFEALSLVSLGVSISGFISYMLLAWRKTS